MNDLNQKLITALVVIPIVVGVFRTPKEMMIAVAAIGLALVFCNLEKFTRFKGAGFEAELRTAVDRVYAAIEELRELGLSLSRPIVDDLAMSGRMFEYIHLKHKLERVEKIAETLRKLGASQPEIDDVCSTIYLRVSNDHMRHILYSLRSSNPGKEVVFEGIEDGKMDTWDRSTVDAFIRENGLTITPETEECFLDREYFLKNRKLRREDKWQS